MTGWLLVRSAGRTLALPIGAVEELVEIAPPLPAPGVRAAVRGVAPYRGRLVPLVHATAIIGDAAPPLEVATTGVAVRVGGRRILLEVDDTAAMTTAPQTPLPPGWHAPWASGAVRRPEGLVPVLDLEWVMNRLQQPDMGHSA